MSRVTLGNNSWIGYCHMSGMMITGYKKKKLGHPSEKHNRHRHSSDSRPRYDRRRSRFGSPYSWRHGDDVTEEAELVTDMFTRTVAVDVRGHDAEYEVNLKERERNNLIELLINKNVSVFVA
jgi:hypothetical protein